MSDFILAIKYITLSYLYIFFFMKLYSEKILKLATEIPNIGRLEEAEKEISLRSPICGSKVTIYINK